MGGWVGGREVLPAPRESEISPAVLALEFGSGLVGLGEVGGWVGGLSGLGR